ncbi:hypothetical protein AM588_10007324 [Phytophthora nicotianae]|uniref:PDEase domain-containing protein n=1 Tax=Phytophthora nicotianae TaxID=4792 RepID=A0A0W8DNM5_PHYNI|nr:hypothetical protein AM588_10007324 [Phytophthora nicotianae]
MWPVAHPSTCVVLPTLPSVQRRYHAHPYHNGIVNAPVHEDVNHDMLTILHFVLCLVSIAAEHAADVAQTLHHFLSVGNLGSLFTERIKCTALLAAIIHDVVSAAASWIGSLMCRNLTELCHRFPGSHKLQQQFPHYGQRRLGRKICVPLSTRAHALCIGLPIDEGSAMQHSTRSHKDRAARGKQPYRTSELKATDLFVVVSSGP